MKTLLLILIAVIFAVVPSYAASLPDLTVTSVDGYPDGIVRGGSFELNYNRRQPFTFQKMKKKQQ